MENVNEEKAKAYELRDLVADDLFPMFNIISKIGFREFKACFDTDEIRGVIKNLTSDAEKKGKQMGKEDIVTAVGMSLVFDIAGVILSHMADCKDDIYLLLSQLSGMSVKDIGKLPMVTFMEMVTDVVKKKEFLDFFQAAVKLLK